MNKQEITRSLESACGSPFVSLNQISAYLKVDKRKAVILLDGVEFWKDGKAHKYFAQDVATRIMENRGGK